ncbi:hypothetical protein KIH74_34735 [Kineosporia sp. J2-2]|uniref:HEXXH motif-containing protein n=1 Tax=Kineosporia corallincola TaxID=2835133 RepID=A0ABS5TTL6_9ACTN|nr:HEXXH motif-containing putative peptide modification protein [Kineosporia corallincola]MBT0774154.1 hypothetical protein [Kineosporia corallincola]
MPDFTFTPTNRLHEERTHRIYSLLHHGDVAKDKSPARALAYALAHHSLEGSEAAARAGDAATFDWYANQPLTEMRGIFTLTVAGPRVVVSPELDQLPRSPISETPYYVIGDQTQPPPAETQTLAAGAFAVASDAGFGELLHQHAVVMCLLRSKSLGQTLDSWTITRLPGTVFMDHVNDPVILGRDLIHEAGHNWLNDALTATDTKIDDQSYFWSPWKQSQRPAFGFIHACWAFPLTMIYSAWARDKAEPEIAEFLTTYLNKQRPLLAETSADHQQAMKLIPDQGLRERLIAVYEQALTL